MADRLRQGAQETVRGAVSAEAPDTITSPDLIGRGLVRNGATYRMTGQQDGSGNFIYKKVS